MGVWLRSLHYTNERRRRRIELENDEWQLRLLFLKDTGVFTEDEKKALEIIHSPEEAQFTDGSGIFDVTAEKAQRCAEALRRLDTPDFLGELKFRDTGRILAMTRSDLWELMEFLETCGGFWVCCDL